MESVLKSIGGLDDVYAVRAASGTSLRRLSQSVSSSAAQISGSGKIYSLAEGRAAADLAVANAADILDRLDDLRSQLSIADGIRTPSLRTDGTRPGVQSQIAALVGQIDTIVAQSSAAGLNLLAQPGELTRIRTTQYGGTLILAGQPLDSASLGIDSLDVSNQAGVEKSIAQVEAAIKSASVRYDQLASASQGLRADTAFDSALVRGLRGLNGGKSLSTGALVNLRS
jgi:hypothetical protein